MHHYTIIGIFNDPQETVILDLTTAEHFQLPEQSAQLYAEATKERIKALIEAGNLSPEDDPAESENVAAVTWVAAIEADTREFSYTTDWKDAI